MESRRRNFIVYSEKNDDLDVLFHKKATKVKYEDDGKYEDE